MIIINDPEARWRGYGWFLNLLYSMIVLSKGPPGWVYILVLGGLVLHTWLLRVPKVRLEPEPPDKEADECWRHAPPVGTCPLAPARASRREPRL